MKRKFFFLLILLLLTFISILLYSRYFGTSGLIIKEYAIKKSNIASHFHGLKIVHLSDIHYNKVINSPRLKQIATKINQLKPDIIFLTGDLLDQETTQEDQISNLLMTMKASLGKYMIEGNHDKSSKNWKQIAENGGFIVLENEIELIYNQGTEPIILFGMSSNYDDNKANEKYKTFENFLTSNPNYQGLYKILLIHEPDYIEQFDYQKFDLILAGHSHGGQVRIPFLKPFFVPKGAQKYYNEYYQLDATDLYVSSGIGNSILNLRLFNRPSFNFYRLNT